MNENDLKQKQPSRRRMSEKVFRQRDHERQLVKQIPQCEARILEQLKMVIVHVLLTIETVSGLSKTARHREHRNDFRPLTMDHRSGDDEQRVLRSQSLEREAPAERRRPEDHRKPRLEQRLIHHRAPRLHRHRRQRPSPLLPPLLLWQRTSTRPIKLLIWRYYLLGLV